MGLYSREQYDVEMEMLERESQSISIAVAAGQINGFEALRWERAIEVAKAKAKGRLLGTIRMLSDAARNQKSVRKRFEISEQNKQLLGDS